ncbi:MAG: hypothetical protein K0S81_307 [Rhodospirillales bacterium]|jgi:hypothetical protein|nr:hypothetical protein [Rhodospirillales bacterium]
MVVWFAPSSLSLPRKGGGEMGVAFFPLHVNSGEEPSSYLFPPPPGRERVGEGVTLG